MNLDQASTEFVAYLQRRVVSAARGDNVSELEVDPAGKFWLGRLASEEKVRDSAIGDRGERLEPCAMGIRLLPEGKGPWSFVATVHMTSWKKLRSGQWRKTKLIHETVSGEVAAGPETQHFGAETLAKSLEAVSGNPDLAAELRVDKETTADDRLELTFLLVNTSPKESVHATDTILYECRFELQELKTRPYVLEGLPDSFRYDRDLPAYGVNCGVHLVDDASFATSDVICTDRYRPSFWNSDHVEPDFSFDALAENPLPTAERLYIALEEWGHAAWGGERLKERATSEGWSEPMYAEALEESQRFLEELYRIGQGIRLLREQPDLQKAFMLANRAMKHAARGYYEGWRPFQLGFLLANLPAIAEPEEEVDTVDIVWFATGGGKTETYLGLLVTTALLDRMRGKRAGITAWSRFPLRMLSLQQTQRFANALAGAELARRKEKLGGAPFSLGFFVGAGGTPNAIRPDAKDSQPDPDDDCMPRRYQVLLECPFCRRPTVEMAFNRRYWKLEHRCTNGDCTWPDIALPIYIVDQELYRFLPTVVVGTLDKAASIAMQAAMRGFVGAPRGVCSEEGHGYTYAPRRERPNGCLVPGCRGGSESLPQAERRYGPSFRLQDELHLLKDSLGAVDAHYEALYDALQQHLCGKKPKILASSATLTGYEKQVEVLYNRKARVFPLPPPSTGHGFWSADSNHLMRRFIALAPRGVTLEFALDRLLTELQAAVRDLLTNPEDVCTAAGIDPEHATDLISLYGTDVVYGNTLRDLDAVLRSVETQVRVGDRVNTASLTGRTDFDDVRLILNRLEKPEEDFLERLHVIAASSMMSHGVDIDRLNVMAMLGVPLTTAEFIQATARVGRRYPGLVFVVHKMGRERDAGVFRSFQKYVEQGDRFVEPIPITRRSRRVLEKTVVGLELARLLMLYEPESDKALTMVRAFRQYATNQSLDEVTEQMAIADVLGLHSDLDEPLRRYLKQWFSAFFRNLQDPGGAYRFPSELSPTGEPMRSLRDVEEQVPIYGSQIK